MNGPVLRLLDANANRAREALRVLEDYARFVLNDDGLCGDLKRIRHEMAESLGPLLFDAILHRDTPGDVGTSIKTETEARRGDIGEVVTAAGKRLGEALRAIEEYLKITAPEQAPRIEALRYRFYDVEQRMARTLHSLPSRFANVRLYVLITESCCNRPWLETAEQALIGGADCLQLREKGLDSAELLKRADCLARLCHDYNKLCIINDRPDIAVLSGADGVHVGQEDMPARRVRQLLGREMIVGVSTHNLAQARQAMLDGADYIGVGPLFRSSTKPRDFIPGLDFARQVAADIPIPAVAIAGITQENVDEVLATGLRAIAVTKSVTWCGDPRAAAEHLKAVLAEG